MELRLHTRLKKFYPNGVVKALQKTNPSLYGELSRYGLEHNMKPKEVIEYLGFQYVRKRKYDETPLDVIEEQHKQFSDSLMEDILALFPNKQLPALIQLKQQHPKLEKRMVKAARQEGKTEKEFWEDRGFVVGKYKKKRNIDWVQLRKLHHDYQCHASSELAEVLEVTRQHLKYLFSHDMKQKRNQLWEDKLTKQEKKEILSLIRNKLFSHKNHETFIRIYKHREKPKQFAVFYKKREVVKCLFSIPKAILKELIANRFDELDQKDFEILKEIEKKGVPKGETLQIKPTEKRLAKLLAARIQTSQWSSKKEYISFLGWNYTDTRTLTYEEIRQRILPYIDEEGYFRMATKDEGYFSLRSFFIGRGFRSTQEWVEYFGFKYKRTRNVQTEKTYKERLRHFIVYDNKVYINSATNRTFYQSLGNFGKRKKLTLNETIQLLGYERISKEELPEGFVPYIWQPSSSRKITGPTQIVLNRHTKKDNTRDLFSTNQKILQPV